VLEHGLDLLSGDAGEPIEEFFQPCAGLEILKQRADRHPRAPEHPGAAHPVRVAFGSEALRPVPHRKDSNKNLPGWAFGLHALRALFAAEPVEGKWGPLPRRSPTVLSRKRRRARGRPSKASDAAY
jgi:hypothetical protein